MTLSGEKWHFCGGEAFRKPPWWCFWGVEITRKWRFDIQNERKLLTVDRRPLTTAAWFCEEPLGSS